MGNFWGKYIGVWGLLCVAFATQSHGQTTTSTTSVDEVGIRQGINDWLRAYSGLVDSVGKAENNGLLALSDFIRANGLYRQLVAQADLLHAQALTERYAAQRKRLDNIFWSEQVKLFHIRFKQYQADNDRIRNEAARFRSRIRAAEDLKLGNATPESVNAFRQILKRLKLSTAKTSMAKLIGPLGPENFVPRYSYDGHAQRLPPYPGGNAWTLIDYLDRNRVGMQEGYAAHTAILDVFEAIEVTLDQDLVDLEQKSEELLSTFLSMINQMGFPPSTVGTVGGSGTGFPRVTGTPLIPGLTVFPDGSVLPAPVPRP
jgi:hypothetical protein